MLRITKKSSNVTYYLIEVEGKTIGAMRIRKNEKTYVLVQILILPEYQNKGYAQQAIREVETLSVRFRDFAGFQSIGRTR